jgi:parallel beta-helix repeat protein
MSAFTKTLIVDVDLVDPVYPYYNNIASATKYLSDNNLGGKIVVESGEYVIDGTGDKLTVDVPSNTTIIGPGNVVVKVTANVPAFRNFHYNSGSDSNIVISGFKIVIAYDENDYSTHPIWLQNTTNCIVEKVYVTSKYVVGETETLYRIDNNSNAIFIQGTVANGSHGNTIRQCTVADYGKKEGDEYYYGSGIGLFASSETEDDYIARNIVINNFTSNTLYGCYMVGARQTVVRGNVFSCANFSSGGIRSTGVSARYCDGSSIIGNIMRNNISHGIYISNSSNCTVFGNISSQNEECGIKVNSGDVDSQYNTIVGNVCNESYIDHPYGDQKGIFITGQYGGKSMYNTISGNVCCNNQSTGIFEGTPGNADNNVFSGNMCVFNQAWEGNIYTSGAGTIVADNMEKSS